MILTGGRSEQSADLPLDSSGRRCRVRCEPRSGQGPGKVVHALQRTNESTKIVDIADPSADIEFEFLDDLGECDLARIGDCELEPRHNRENPCFAGFSCFGA